MPVHALLCQQQVDQEERGVILDVWVHKSQTSRLDAFYYVNKSAFVGLDWTQHAHDMS